MIYYTSAEVGRMAGISRQRVRQLLLSGRLIADEVNYRGDPLFSETTVERYLQSRTQQKYKNTHPYPGEPCRICKQPLNPTDSRWGKEWCHHECGRVRSITRSRAWRARKKEQKNDRGIG